MLDWTKYYTINCFKKREVIGVLPSEGRHLKLAWILRTWPFFLYLNFFNFCVGCHMCIYDVCFALQQCSFPMWFRFLQPGPHHCSTTKIEKRSLKSLLNLSLQLTLTLNGALLFRPCCILFEDSHWRVQPCKWWLRLKCQYTLQRVYAVSLS